MAQNITIGGASYSDVPAIDVPKVGGGIARFIDPVGTKQITENGNYDVTQFARADVNVPQAMPIEVSTDAGMSAVLTAANVGKVYKFIGTTGTYTNGDLYIVEASS